MSIIVSELDFVYIYKEKRFLNKEDALKYKAELDKEELIKECQGKLDTLLGVGFAQKDFK